MSSVCDIAVTDLAWMLQLPLWQYRGRRFVVAPADVLASPAQYPSHYARVLDASLDHPVLFLPYRGRPTILDGVHRLAHAALRNQPALRAMVLSPADYSAICD